MSRNRLVEIWTDELNDIQIQKRGYTAQIHDPETTLGERDKLLAALDELSDREQALTLRLIYVDGCEHVDIEEYDEGLRICLDCGREW